MNPEDSQLPVVISQRDPSPEQLIATAIERGVPIETMERLLSMRRELKAEKAKADFFAALAAFQAECPTIVKTKAVTVNGSVRYKYAPFEEILKQVGPLLQKHGFSHTEDSVTEIGWVTGTSTAHHTGGHERTTTFKVPTDPKAHMSDAQKYASAMTFAKRYAFCAGFGILTGDEDNDGASQPTTAAAAAAEASGNGDTDDNPLEQAPLKTKETIQQSRKEKAEYKAWFDSFLPGCKKKLIGQIAPLEAWAWHKYAIDSGWILPNEVIEDAQAQAIFKTVVISATKDQNISQVRSEFDAHVSAVAAMVDNLPDADKTKAMENYSNCNKQRPVCPFCGHTSIKDSEKLVDIKVCGFCMKQWNKDGIEYEEHSWQCAMCPVPPPGVTAKEYIPITLGQMMRMDNRRAYGFIQNYKVGEKFSPEDKNFEAACAEAKAYFESKRKLREDEPDSGDEPK